MSHRAREIAVFVLITWFIVVIFVGTMSFLWLVTR